MKTTFILLITIFLFWHQNSYSQYPYSYHHSRVYVYPDSRLLKIGEMYYSPNYQGLKNLMFDFQMNNPELHDILLPEFNRIRKKRSRGIAVIVSSEIIGTTLIISGSTFLKDEIIPFSDNSFFEDQVTYMPNALLIVTGVCINTIGLFGGAFLLPNREDIFRFVNYHNRHTKQEKIEWEISMHVMPLDTGLSLVMNF